MQSAFSTHHPKFPWPKSHDLVDQTPEFQQAFTEFANEVQAYCNIEAIEAAKIEQRYYQDEITRLESDLSEARRWNIFYLFTIGLAVGAFIIGFIVGEVQVV